MAYLLTNKVYDGETDLSNVIEHHIQNDELEAMFVIVPTGKHVRYLDNMIIKDYFARHNKPCGESNIFTIKDFVIYCYRKLFPNSKFRIVSDAYTLALFEEAANNSDLALYGSKKKKISGTLLERLANVVYGLKEDGITIQSLKDDIRKAMKEKDESVDINRLGDIVKIYTAYQELIYDNIFDFPELLRKTTDILKSRKDKSDLFPKNANIFISGFSEFKNPEADFFSVFAKSNVPFCLNLEYSDTNGPLFGNLEDNIMTLTKGGFTPLKTFDDKNLKKRGIQISSFLKRWLFNKDIIVEKNKKLSSIINIFSMASRKDEVKYIAKLIKYLHIKKNIPLHRICVVMRQTDIYTGLFREIFSQNLIPMNISDRFDLKTSPVTTAVFALLDVLAKGYRREDMHRTLSNSYFTFENKYGKEIDNYNMYNVALQLRIKGGNRRDGSKYWLEKFKGAVESRVSLLHKMEGSEYEDDFDIQKTKKQLQSIENAYSDFQDFIKILPKTKNKLRPSEFAIMIKKHILQKLKVKKNIVSYFDYISENKDKYSEIEYSQFMEKAEKDARAYKALIELVDEMVFILQDLKPDAEFPFDELIDQLRTSVSAKKYQIKEKNNHGVNITAIEQTRGIPYDVMILCGAIDGEFPMNYNPETFLGKELIETEIRHKKSEYMQFYQFLTNNPANLDNCTQKLYITYPQEDNAQELPPSSFINALLEISTIKEDNKIYHIPNILAKNNRSRLEVTEKKQLKEIPWVRSISNKSEQLKNYARFLYKKGSGDIQFSEEFTKSKDAVFVKHFIDNYNKYIEKGHIHIDDLPDESKDSLIDHAEKPYSISALELYAKCPFQFFMKKVMKVQEDEEFDIILSPLELGNLLHIIVYKFYVELQNEKSDPEIEILSGNKEIPIIKIVSLDPSMHNYYLDKITTIAKDEYSKFKFNNPFFNIQKNKVLSSEEQISILEQFLKNEYTKQSNGWNFLPGLFEFSFGFLLKIF